MANDQGLAKPGQWAVDQDGYQVKVILPMVAVEPRPALIVDITQVRATHKRLYGKCICEVCR